MREKAKLRLMMMAMLTKLLDIRMVAKRRSESSNNFLINLSTGSSSSSIALLSTGDSEKKAISDAETKPEMKSMNTTANKTHTTPIVGAESVTPPKRCVKLLDILSISNSLCFSEYSV
jgi:hypothetical protein